MTLQTCINRDVAAFTGMYPNKSIITEVFAYACHGNLPPELRHSVTLAEYQEHLQAVLYQWASEMQHLAQQEANEALAEKIGRDAAQDRDGVVVAEEQE